MSFQRPRALGGRRGPRSAQTFAAPAAKRSGGGSFLARSNPQGRADCPRSRNLGEPRRALPRFPVPRLRRLGLLGSLERSPGACVRRRRIPSAMLDREQGPPGSHRGPCRFFSGARLRTAAAFFSKIVTSGRLPQTLLCRLGIDELHQHPAHTHFPADPFVQVGNRRASPASSSHSLFLKIVCPVRPSQTLLCRLGIDEPTSVANTESAFLENSLPRSILGRPFGAGWESTGRTPSQTPLAADLNHHRRRSSRFQSSPVNACAGGSFAVARSHSRPNP